MCTRPATAAATRGDSLADRVVSGPDEWIPSLRRNCYPIPKTHTQDEDKYYNNDKPAPTRLHHDP